jgi:hypothetical protein
MNNDAIYDPQYSAALRAALIQNARSSRSRLHARSISRIAIFVGVGVAIGSVGTAGAVWATVRGGSVPSASSTGANPDTLFPSYNDELVQLDRKVEAVRQLYPNVFAWEWFDASTVTLHIEYWSSADADGITKFTGALAKIGGHQEVKVEVEPTAYDVVHLEQVAKQISQDSGHYWSDYFGTKIVGTYVDNKTGTIVVGVDKVPTNAPRATPDGSPVELETSTVELQ